MSCESRLLPDYGPVFRKESRVPFIYIQVLVVVISFVLVYSKKTKTMTMTKIKTKSEQEVLSRNDCVVPNSIHQQRPSYCIIAGRFVST